MIYNILSTDGKIVFYGEIVFSYEEEKMLNGSQHRIKVALQINFWNDKSLVLFNSRTNATHLFSKSVEGSVVIL